ncbi:MAG: hypothetical protein HY962_07170 [Ignavibacteriae bacterium]|nr:hypothetical protein [Ignavibacteriota bacterium]
MKTVLMLVVMCATLCAQTTVESVPYEQDNDSRISLRGTRFVFTDLAGLVQIGPDDSATVSIDGLTSTDFAIVSYANRGPVLQAAEEPNVGWAIWQDGILTVYGRNDSYVLYLILRVLQ